MSTNNKNGESLSLPPTSKLPTKGFSAVWTSLILNFRQPFDSIIKKVALTSASSPKLTIFLVILISCGLMGTGLYTNFRVEVDEDILWTPQDSFPSQHLQWIEAESGFPVAPRAFLLLFHQDGDQENLITREQLSRTFQVLDTIRTLPGYDTVCAGWEEGDCRIAGVTNFWNNNVTLYERDVATDEDVAEQLSAPTFPDGTPTKGGMLLGRAVYDETKILTSAQSMKIVISFPQDEGDDTTTAADFEELALDAVLGLNQEWTASDSPFRVEVFAERSFADEFQRSILADIPLVPIVFAIMGIFTSFIFWKRDRVHSRSLLGFMAVVSVLLSIMAGYGLMFICGVPFTSMTQILPFIFFGVGLDDSFIITGSYFRLDSKKDPVERVAETMDDIGISIFLTTMTSALAFGLGAISSIPGVFWLVIYAVPTIVFILLWQLTFFVACLVLDERRVQMNNRDCFRCIQFVEPSNTNHDDTSNQESAIDKAMGKYARFLLQPVVKLIVLVGFVALATFCGLSASNLQQAFTFTDVLPSDSYITPFFNSLDAYSEDSVVTPYFFFRGVDQSSTKIREQMDQFINEVSVTKAFSGQPDRCWFRDFHVFVAEQNMADEPFSMQMNSFLEDSVYGKLYKDHVVLDPNGTITSSRCQSVMKDIDVENVKSQTDALKSQEEVTLSQTVNLGQEDHLKFFTYDGNYLIWEFFYRSASEIMFTTLASVAAVTIVAILFIPHWTAVFFVLPLIAVLYIDLLGVMQWAGIDINPVSYITLVMSIGLLVDFILHNLIRYYEVHGNRDEKVIEMLKSMGSSILVGGITTFLGTLPLAFSSSAIFRTVFVSFIAIVTLGAAHGLVLLPVVLSILGPEDIALHASPMENGKANLANVNAAEAAVAKSPVVQDSEFPGLDLEFYNEVAA